MELIERLKKLFSKSKTVESVEPVEEPVGNENIQKSELNSSLLEWKSTVEAVKNHPLSQVKVINTQILDSLSRVLDSIDYKLDKLDKLDEILDLLKKGREKIEKQGVEIPEISEAIRKLENESIKDKEVLDVLTQHEMLSAEELASRMGISRSTASYRLNRLVNAGLVEKVPQGKKVFFKIKTSNQ